MLLSKIEIQSVDLQTITTKAGKSFKLQSAYLHVTGRAYPAHFTFLPPLSDGVIHPYSPGFYTIDPKCIVVESSRLQLSYLILVPFPTVSK